MSGGDQLGIDFLPEELVINILLRLPIVWYIARLRCVCRSWRKLLSDLDFIRKIIYFQSSDDQKALRILMIGGVCTPMTPTPLFRCSLNSYDTLLPVKGYHDLLGPDGGAGSYNVRGCCDGIFCLTRNGYDSYSIVLWNPVTSETKILPPHSAPDYSRKDIGLGFDPLTKDYKVILVTAEYEPEEIDHAPTLVYTEKVYSLRNDSWQTLNVSNDDIFVNDRAIYLHQQQWGGTSRNKKCHWLLNIWYQNICGVLSFDMSTQVFESVTFSIPPCLVDQYAPSWQVESCSMLKGMIVVDFFDCNFSESKMETWAMLKCGVPESWTKLFTSPENLYFFHYMDVWKDGMHICSSYIHNRIFICDLATGEFIRYGIEIEGTNNLFQVCVFVPTRASLSLLE
ncbi:F-box protein CPR1 [Linum perenne]